MRSLPRLAIALAAALLAAETSAAPQSVPLEPVLRVETGGHLALITKVSADDQGRWVLTAAEDKTARIWDASTGKLLNVLRPPLGPESIGALYAAALSPDGKVAALGGNAAFDGRSQAIYLFDRASGRLPPKSTLAGLEAPITQLAWSKDSQLLAVGLRQQGLRVFRRNLGFVGTDPEYNEAIYGADFSRDGRLVTAAADGSLRVYVVQANGMERVARKATPGGKPYNVAFSPDGALIAVGYQDVARVDVLDAMTLNPLYSASIGGNGNLGRIAWSGDGRTLFAGGTANSGGRFQLYAFADAGRGKGREIGAYGNIITSIATTSDGVVAASAEPSWTRYDASGSPRLTTRPQTGDFRDAGESFRVADDGHLIIFPMAAGGKDALAFDMTRADLRPVAQMPPGVQAPKVPGWTSGPSDWKNSAAPKAGGRLLALRPNEISRSIALTADKKRFLLGTEWNVRAFDSDGTPLWERRTSGAAWAVNLTADGRWAVAALGDGSVRWYRMSDGQEQMALFVHADRNRWILWTPSGYYDTSIGGEELVGWHLNRAFNQASDFFSVGRFRDRFYRPDIVQKVLELADEGEAIRRAQADMAALATSEAAIDPAPSAPPPKAGKPAKKDVPTKEVPSFKPALVATEKPDVSAVLPPVIELASDSRVETAAATVPVRFTLRSPGDAPVKEVKVRVNDKLSRSLGSKDLKTTRGDAFEVPVSVPPGDAEIRLFASNKNGKSEPVLVQVKRPGAPVKLPNDRYETLYLLIVGVSKYPGEWALGLPDKDARDFNHNMARQAGKLYGTVVPKLLINEDATRQKVIDGLKWLRDTVGEKDAGIVFLAGHGDKVGSTYYFIPADANALPERSAFKKAADFDAWKQKNAPSLWVPGDEIAKTLLGLKGRAAFFVDTCHSGQAAQQAKLTQPDMTGTLNEIDDEKGVIIFASSTKKELSQEDEAWGNGAFTKAVIEGIRGKADLKNDGLIRPTLLQSYVSDRVRELTGNEQRPVIFTVGVDDPIAVKNQ